MSGKLKKILFDILSNSKDNLSLEDIINIVKTKPEYQRNSNDSLRPTIKKFLSEIKKINYVTNPKTNIIDNNIDNSKYLNKKKKNTF